MNKKFISTFYFIQNLPKEKTAVAFSGGKDSLVVLHLASMAGIRKAVFSDTTIESQKVIDYAKEVSSAFGVEVEIARPRKTFFELLPLLGPPSTKNRWCCPTVKYQQMNEYARRNGIQIFLTGLRREESSRRRQYKEIDRNPMLPYLVEANPILDWTEQDVWDYIKDNALPLPPGYAEHPRNGCVLCPYKSETELEALQKEEPSIWEPFMAYLKEFAREQGLKDVEGFLKGGWRHYRAPQKRRVIYELPQEGLMKIADKANQKQLRILAEKQLNCVGCGACLSLCPKGALFLSEETGRIDVDASACTRCYDCLRASGENSLRGACIARNYSLAKQKVDASTILGPSKLVELNTTFYFSRL